METIDPRVCTWESRRPRELPLRQARPVAEIPVSKNQSPAIIATICLCVALMIAGGVTLNLSKNKEAAVAESSEPSTSSSDPSSQGTPVGIGALPTAPSAIAPSGPQRPPTTAPTAPGAPTASGPPAGAANAGSKGAAPALQPDDGSTHIQNPPVSLRFISCNVVSAAGAQAAFHCSVQVRNDGVESLEYSALPTLELVFDDGTSYRASPVAPKGKLAGEKKESDPAMIAGGGTVTVDFVATANRSPATSRLIEIQVHGRSGSAVILPLQR